MVALFGQVLGAIAVNDFPADGDPSACSFDPRTPNSGRRSTTQRADAQWSPLSEGRDRERSIRRDYCLPRQEGASRSSGLREAEEAAGSRVGRHPLTERPLSVDDVGVIEKERDARPPHRVAP